MVYESPIYVFDVSNNARCKRSGKCDNAARKKGDNVSYVSSILHAPHPFHSIPFLGHNTICTPAKKHVHLSI